MHQCITCSLEEKCNPISCAFNIHTCSVCGKRFYQSPNDFKQATEGSY